jgi:Flp pilus assembly CpaE family ATPase
MSRKLKILLIDDDEKTHKVVRETLPEDEFELRTSYETHAGMGEVLKFIPDLILLDYILPEISGMDALRELKSHQLTKNIPVVVMSSAGNQSIIESFYQLGAIDFVNKPLVPRILREKIRSLASNMRLLQKNVATSVGNITGFFGVKGGVGTSTVAANSALLLAKALEDDGKSVLLMDANKFSSAISNFFDVSDGVSLCNLMKEHPFDLDQDYLFEILTRVSDNFYLLPSASKLGHFELGRVDDFAVVIHILSGAFDNIIVDMDMSFGDSNLWLLENVNTLMLVTNGARSSLQNLHETVETLLRIGIDKGKLGLVHNMYDKSDKIDEDGLMRFVGVPRLGVFRNYPDKYRDAEEGRMPVVALTRSPTTAEYKKFVDILIELSPVPVAATTAI